MDSGANFVRMSSFVGHTKKATDNNRYKTDEHLQTS